MNSRKPANNYNTTSWSGYCPNSTVREDGQQAHDGRGVDRRRGRRCALWIMAALERSCEPDVPACQQQLCIIGCLPHVNACLLSPFARTVHPLQHCSLSLSLSLPPFLLWLDGPSVHRRSFPSTVATRGQIYELVHYNKQWRSNEPSLTVKYRFRFIRVQRSESQWITIGGSSWCTDFLLRRRRLNFLALSLHWSRASIILRSI